MLKTQLVTCLPTYGEVEVSTAWVLEETETSQEDLSYLKAISEMCPWAKLIVYGEEWSADDNCWMPTAETTTVGKYYPYAKRRWEELEEWAQQVAEEIPF